MLSPCTALKLHYGRPDSWIGLKQAIAWQRHHKIQQEDAVAHLDADKDDQGNKKCQDDGLLPVVYTKAKHLPSEGVDRGLLILVLQTCTSVLCWIHTDLHSC